MSFTNTGENLILKVLFDGGTATGVAAAATGVASWYVSLHTASPGETASGAETTYSGYARKAVSRTSGWTVTGNSVSPAANIDFNVGTTGATGTLSHFGLFTASTGGTCYLYGTITPNIVMAAGVTPRLTTSSTISLD